MQRLIIKHVCHAQSRFYSTATAEKRLIYATPNAPLVKLAKMFSLSTLGISSASAPAVIYFWESPAIQASGISSNLFLGEITLRYIFLQFIYSALFASICSTGAIHYILSPFISTIQLHASSSPTKSVTPNSIVSLETRDLLARKRYTTLAIKDLEPANGLLQTWKVNRKVLHNQYAAEQRRGAVPSIRQTRFWLDRGGAADQEAMASMMRIIQENQQKQRIV